MASLSSYASTGAPSTTSIWSASVGGVLTDVDLPTSILQFDITHSGEQNQNGATRELKNDLVKNAMKLVELYFTGIEASRLQQILAAPSGSLWKVWWDTSPDGNVGQIRQEHGHTAAPVPAPMYRHSLHPQIYDPMNLLFSDPNNPDARETIGIEKGQQLDWDVFGYDWRELMEILYGDQRMVILVRIDKVKLERPNDKLYLTLQFYITCRALHPEDQT